MYFWSKTNTFNMIGKDKYIYIYMIGKETQDGSFIEFY